MTTITVYDPAMCCSTGICGTDVDQKLVDLAADLDWLKAKGVTVRRFGLSREPTEFAANDTIRKLMEDSDGDDLPAFLVDGRLFAKAHYPSRAELAGWTGIALEAAAAEPAIAAASGCCGAGELAAPMVMTGSRRDSAAKAASGGCCGGGTNCCG